MLLIIYSDDEISLTDEVPARPNFPEGTDFTRLGAYVGSSLPVSPPDLR